MCTKVHCCPSSSTYIDDNQKLQLLLLLHEMIPPFTNKLLPVPSRSCLSREINCILGEVGKRREECVGHRKVESGPRVGVLFELNNVTAMFVRRRRGVGATLSQGKNGRRVVDCGGSFCHLGLGRMSQVKSAPNLPYHHDHVHPYVVVSCTHGLSNHLSSLPSRSALSVAVSTSLLVRGIAGGRLPADAQSILSR